MLVREREWRDTRAFWSDHREGGWGSRYLVGDGTDFDGDVLLPGFSQDRRVLAQSKSMANPGRVQYHGIQKISVYGSSLPIWE